VLASRLLDAPEEATNRARAAELGRDYRRDVWVSYMLSSRRKSCETAFSPFVIFVGFVAPSAHLPHRHAVGVADWRKPLRLSQGSITFCAVVLSHSPASRSIA